MYRRRPLFPFGPIAMLLMLLGSLQVAMAQRSQEERLPDTRYQHARLRRLKACVLLVPTPGDPDAGSQTQSPNPNPYLFYVLNERSDMRPDGWRFYNPAAPTYPTYQHTLRWGAGLSPTAQLASDMAPYWEVVLSEANYQKLAQMDVIYLPVARRDSSGNNPLPTLFTEEQRQILTKLADGGVTIWVDWGYEAQTQSSWLGGTNGSTPTTRTRNGFFTNLDTVQYGGAAGAPTVGHPLLTALFSIQPTEAVEIGSTYSGAAGPSDRRALLTRIPGEQPTCNFTSVVPVGTSPGANTMAAYVAAARYGSGYVVGTAGNVGRAVAGMIPAGTLRASTVTPRPDLSQAQYEDLKFAYNVFAWRGEVIAGQKNARHTAQSSVQVNGMIEQWNFPYLVPDSGGYSNYPPSSVPIGNLPANPAAPLVVDGIVVAAVRYFDGGNAVSALHAFEANPADDFDSNGYSDDPVNSGTTAGNAYADIAIGQNYDRVMHVDLGSPTAVVNGLTVGEVPDPTATIASQGSRPLIFGSIGNFSTGQGELFALPAPRPGLLPTDYWGPSNLLRFDNSVLRMLYTGAPSFVNIPAPIPSSGPPVVASQLIAGGISQSVGIASSTAGKVASYEVPYTGNPVPAWYYPPNLEANRLGPPVGPAVTAQVQDVGTGAIDTMVFVTTAADPNQRQGGQVAGDTNGKVEGFILATKGELLGFPTANNQPNAQTPDFGRRFTAVRWLNMAPNSGPVPPGPELAWDPTRHFEVRVLYKGTGYVAARFVRGDAGFQLLTDGTGGQVLLPAPGNLTPPAGLPTFNEPGRPTVWNLRDYVLVADYSWLPIPVDNNQGRTLRPRFSPPTPYVRNATGGISPVQLTGVAGGVSVGKDNLVYYGTGNGYMCAVEWRRGRPQFRWKFRSLEYQNGSGTISDMNDLNPASPNYLDDFVFSAAPAAGDRIVFASRGKGLAPGTAYVFDPDATVRFKLPLPNDPMTGSPLTLTPAIAQDIVLEGDHGVGIQQTAGGVMSGIKANLPPFGQLPNQFSVNPDTGVVTFNNMLNISLDLGQALSPEQLINATALAIDTDGDGAPGPDIDTGGKPAAPIRWWVQPAGYTLSGVWPSANNRRRAWVALPLVATYRGTAPGPSSGEQWRSGPVISGDRVYLMGATGHLHEVPLDPKTIDPRFPVRRNGATVVTGLDGHNAGNHVLYPPDGLRRVRGVSYTAGSQPANNPPPAISQGIVAVNTPRGLVAYASPNVVVADTNRIVEASGDSIALASLDVTVKHRIDQNEFAIPTDPSLANTGGFPILTERKLLSRPAVIRKLNRASSLTSIFASTSTTVGQLNATTPAGQNAVRETTEWADESYLAADTGNNRCVEFNPSGKVIWELNQFQDPFGLLPAGETTKLSGPMDVQRWVELEQVGSELIHVVHTLIADTGNTRVIEVVDKVRYQRGVFNPGSYVTVPGQAGLDGQDVRWYHVLVWSSQTNAQGLRLRYRTAQRLFWPDASGALIPNPNASGRTASTTYPYLPQEQYLSYTMCSVAGQQVIYKPPTQRVGYNQFHAITAVDRALIERKPDVRPGGDSIVFLRGRLKLDEGNPTTPVPVTTVRENRPGAAATGDSIIYAQGIIDPNVAVINNVYQEFHPSITSPDLERPVHRLNGVSSIQRTIRSDLTFAPDLLAGGQPIRNAHAMFFLIADTDGVWEIRMLPSAPVNVPQHRLAWAFTIEDYAYVTGAGNGDPTTAITNPAGGRLLSPASARRLPNGLVLIASRTPLNPLPPNNSASLLHAGADVFLLRPTDYHTATVRAAQGSEVPYRRNLLIDGGGPLHGWQPDLWVQTGGAVPPPLRGSSSIRWRAAEALDPSKAPSLRTGLQGGPNPLELTGTYIPVQPNFADLVF